MHVLNIHNQKPKHIPKERHDPQKVVNYLDQANMKIKHFFMKWMQHFHYILCPQKLMQLQSISIRSVPNNNFV